jgi:hypothetical protein
MLSRRLFELTFSLFLVALFLGQLEAGKSPKPQPVDKGFIYFIGDGQSYRMLSDGTGKAAVPVDLTSFPEPSRRLHGGHQWFLTALSIEGEVYPDGAVRHELCALSDGGDVVQLTLDPDLEPSPEDSGRDGHGRWASEAGVVDAKVSWFARKWDRSTGTVVDFGLYAIVFDPETLGPAFAPRTPSKVEMTFSTFYDDGFSPIVDRPYDWSPEGNRVAYADYPAGSPPGISLLCVAAVGSADPPVVVATGSRITSPRWSPARADGSSSIAFIVMDTYTLDVVNPDGSGHLTLVGSNGAPLRGNYAENCLAWSPSGTYVAYTLRSVQRGVCYKALIYVISSAGGPSSSSLSSEFVFSRVVGWPAGE